MRNCRPYGKGSQLGEKWRLAFVFAEGSLVDNLGDRFHCKYARVERTSHVDRGSNGDHGERHICAGRLGTTPWHYAAYAGHADVAQLLARHGAMNEVW